MRAGLALALAGLMGSTVAQAATVSFGGINTSAYGTASRFIYTASALTTKDPVNPDTFYGDTAGNNYCDGYISSPAYNNGGPNPVGNGSYGAYNDTVQHVRLAPQNITGTSNSSGCYSVVNDDDPSGSGTPGDSGGVQFIYSTSPLTYFGFLWGSPDSYNYLRFIAADGTYLNLTFSGITLANPTEITGADVTNALGLGVNPGNAGTTFINFTFSTSENVAGFEIGNNGSCCFEFANLTGVGDSVCDPTVTASQPNACPGAPSSIASALARPAFVPEPAALVMMASGFGLAGLARRRRA